MMKDKSATPSSFVKMEQARRLMDQGHYQESLVLALDVLLQELDTLRNALLALQTVTGKESPAPNIQEEQANSDPHWLPLVKPRILH
jgi:HPt (histidine-containing phosphotransfer) domain-containing protein